MIKKLTNLFIGTTLSSFAIVCVLKAGFGCFSVTACNMALANWLGITIGLAGFLVESIMLVIATKLGEGVGLTALLNASYGSFMIDVFNYLLPVNPLMLLGLPLIGIAWSMMGSTGYGDTGSNILTNALMKKTKKNIGLIRGALEVAMLSIGFIGARSNVTIFTLILSITLGYMLQIIYRFIKYEPTLIKHKFIIKGKCE